MSNAKIMLDPGHGAAGTGANGRIDEAAQAWKLSGFIVAELKALGVEAVLSRTQNERPDLEERARRAKAQGCGVMVSIHFNAGGGDGAEIYPQFFGDKAICRASQVLADALLKGIVAAGQQSRGIKYRPNSGGDREYYGVLYYPRLQGIVSNLLELAFVDTKDALDFDTDAELKKWAGVIARSIASVYPPAIPKVNYTITVKGTGTKAEAEAALAKVKAAGLSGTLSY